MSLPLRSAALGRGILLALTCLAVLGYYRWSVGHTVSQYGNSTAREAAYNLLIDGFRAGHLSLRREPAPELAQLANPYDPEQNRVYRLHDASYYNGRYYLYFGVTPAVVLFLPYTLLTGDYLWHHDAVAIFCAAGFLTAAGIFLAACRRYFPETPVWVQAACLFGLGLANGIPILLRRPDIWEVPIACGSWLLLLTLAALWKWWHDPSRRLLWTAAAAVALGLAIGARPTLIGATLVIAWAIFWQARREPQSSRQIAKLVMAALLPLALIGSGLAAYNYLRFGNPLEFGQRYQLAEANVGQLKLFSVDYVAANLQLYLFTPASWQTYFPFVRGGELPLLPPGQFCTENPYGILTNMPFVWLVLALPLAGRLPEFAGLRGWGWTAMAAAGASLLPLLLFGGMSLRYLVDFVPVLVLLAATGCLVLERNLAIGQGRFRRWAGRLVWGGLLAFSIAFNFFASCELGGVLHALNPPGGVHLGGWLQVTDPAGYARLGRVFNRPIAWLEEIQGARPGPLDMTLKFPPFSNRRIEPLLVTGYDVLADYVWLEYLDANTVQIGVEHTGFGSLVSEPVAVDYSREHQIRIQMGGLYPPAEHPYYDQFDPAEATRRRESVRIDFDGQTVLAGRSPAYAASPATRWIGENRFRPRFGRQFTGRILSHAIQADLP